MTTTNRVSVTWAIGLASDGSPWVSVDRAAIAEQLGQHDLAEVIRDQPGRQIVRDGMVDVLGWLGAPGGRVTDPTTLGEGDQIRVRWRNFDQVYRVRRVSDVALMATHHDSEAIGYATLPFDQWGEVDVLLVSRAGHASTQERRR